MSLAQSIVEKRTKNWSPAAKNRLRGLLEAKPAPKYGNLDDDEYTEEKDEKEKVYREGLV